VTSTPDEPRPARLPEERGAESLPGPGARRAGGAPTERPVRPSFAAEPLGARQPAVSDAPTEAMALGEPGRRPTAAGSLGPGHPEDRDRRSALPPRVTGPGARLDARPARSARRRARLTLRRIDPWSVFTTSLIVSLFLGVVLLVAVAVLYALLNAAGVLSSVNDTLSTIGVTDEGAQFVGVGKVLGIAAVVAAVDVVLVTVLATLFAFLYNVVASLTGGIVVTLSEGE
jgi:hypothetical protein